MTATDSASGEWVVEPYSLAAFTDLAMYNATGGTLSTLYTVMVNDGANYNGMIETGVKISSNNVTIPGNIYSNQFVDCQVTCANAAGTNDAAFSVQVDKWDGSAVTAARDILILVNATEYLPGGLLAVPTATVTFTTATTGTIVASGAGWLHLRTSAAGVFACTCTNSANNTQYFTVHEVGKCPSANWCYPISQGDSATWS
jgi:hypothetical protein